MKILILLASIAWSDVKNPVAFVGQAVLGGTRGAALSTGTSGHLVSGLQNFEASATANVTTGGTTNVYLSMLPEIAPGSGTYLAIASTTFESNSNNANVDFQIFVGGSGVAHTERTGTPQFQGGLTPALNIRLPVKTNGLITVTGTQGVGIRFRTSAGTATARERTLNLLRIQ